MKGTFWESIRRGFGLSIGLSFGLVTTATLGVTVSGTFHTFFAGQAMSSSQINENFANLKTAIEGINPTPVGSIVAWHKSLTGTPNIPTGWVECNGQTIADGDSVYNGQTIPNLNGQFNAYHSKGVFLRGSSTSGVFEDDAFQGHRHLREPGGLSEQFWTAGGVTSVSGGGGSSFAGAGNGTDTGNPVADLTNGTPRTATETRPANMPVVWIMRIK